MIALQGAFYGFVCGMIMGVTRMILDIIYPAPPCGSPETRPAILYKVHFLYYNMMETFVSVVVTVVVSLITKPPDKELVSTSSVGQITILIRRIVSKISQFYFWC